MAEALAIECPPTPEGQIEFPVTPPPRSNPRVGEFLKKQKHHRKGIMSHQHGDESGNSDDEQHRLQENFSPPPNCSICLGRIKSKCFTNSCMHQFCFSCLLEWSKIKPECPLCKQTFKSIIHNVTSMDNYEEYKVEDHRRNPWSYNYYSTIQPLDIDRLILPNLTTFGRAYRPELAAHNRIYQLFLHESPNTERFAQLYATDSIPSRNSGIAWREYVYRRHLYALLLNDPSGHIRNITAEFYRDNPAQMHRLLAWLNRELLCLCTSSQYTVSDILRNIEDLIQLYDITSSSFRRRVRAFTPLHCDHFLHEFINFARSPYDVIGYDRNVMYTPRFQDTEEIVALSSSDEGDVSVVSENSWSASDFRNNQINEENRILLIPGQNGEQQFVHTITPSAQLNRPTAIVNTSDNITPYNLSTSNSNNYASTAPTAPAATTRHPVPGQNALAHIINTSEEDTDEDEIATFLTQAPVVNMDTISGRTVSPVRDTILNSNGERTVIVSLNVNFGENSNTETLGGSSATITTSTTSISTTTINVGGVESESTTMTTTTASISNVQVVTEESDSDDCLFVCAKKPPHLRTPELVELNSDSDSDVVFVNEEKLPSYQVIKKEDNSRGNNNNVIVSPQKPGNTLHSLVNGSSSNTNTNILVSNSRRKRRHGDHELQATKDETKSTDIKPLNVISGICSTSNANNFNTQNGISDKPSTSTEWLDKYISSKIPLFANASVDSPTCNRPNAIVFSASASSAKTNKISLILSRRNHSGKQIFQSSSSERNDIDDDDDDDDSVSTSSSTSSLATVSSSESSSSSHEEYGCPRAALKRKLTKSMTKYYKKTILADRKHSRWSRKRLDKKAERKKLKSPPTKLCKRKKNKSRSRHLRIKSSSSSSEYNSDY